MKYTKSNWLLIFLMVSLLACDEKDRLSINDYANLEIVSGDNQSGITGQFLKDSVVIKVIPGNSTIKLDEYYIKVKMTRGNGYLTEMYNRDLMYVWDNGKLRMTWSLGCDVNDQNFTIYLYHQDKCKWWEKPEPVCAPIDSVTFHATASTPKGWNRSCGIVDPDLATKFKIYNGEQYAVNRGSLYKVVRGDAVWWEKVNGLPVNDLFQFDFNNSGTFYIMSESQGVFSSRDMTNWTSLKDDLGNPRYAMEMLVEDSVVYASYYFHGIYRLRAGSTTWKKLLVNGRYDEHYRFLTRHPDGKLYVTDGYNNIWVSENSGDSWSKIQISYVYMNGEVTDFKIHPSGQIYLGSFWATLSILDPNSLTGDVFPYNQWNSSMQVVKNVTFRNDGVYYQVHFPPIGGIYSSANGYQKYDIGFQDYFYKFVFDPQGNILITNDSGVYYKKE